MRYESTVTAVTWIPSEAISGMPKLPFEAGIAHYDEPLPERLDDLDEWHRRDAFREANELSGWIEVEDGRITGHGQDGRALIGRSEEHTSELQSLRHLVCRLLLENKHKK